MTFSYVLYSHGIPYMACQDVEPLLSFLYDESGANWKPRITRKEAEAVLKELDSVKIVLDGAGTISYQLKRHTYWNTPVVESHARE